MQVIDKHSMLAREAWFCIGLTLVTAVLTTIAFPVYVALLFWVILAFVHQFFRDTHRPIPQDEGIIASPADGKAPQENERNAVWFQAKDGTVAVSVQVVGLVARRILCFVNERSRRQRRERYGFIRFGSQVDQFLPENFSVSVALGDNVSSGTLMLGRFA